MMVCSWRRRPLDRIALCSKQLSSMLYHCGTRGCHRRYTTTLTIMITFIIRRQAHHYTSSSCHAYNLHFAQYHHPFDSNLFDFYRNNFHERTNKKYVPSLPKACDDASDNDAVFVLRSNHNEIFTALRLTKSKHDEQYTFLRSLCVARECRRKGLASRLLEESLQHFDVQHCYCFASPELEHLYNQSGFVSASSCTEGTIKIPQWMTN